MSKELSDLIDSSERILVTSHSSPDPDAVCSSLLLAETIRLNFPTKRVVLNIETDVLPQALNELSAIDTVHTGSLADTVNDLKPDLFIMTDVNKIDRVSRLGADAVRAYLKDNSVSTVIIDHHEPDDRDESTLFINNGSPAATLDVFELIEANKWNLPTGYQDIAMMGILADTGRFRYKNSRLEATFNAVVKFVKTGADIDKLSNKLEQYTSKQMLLIGNLGKNTKVDKLGFSYSYIEDELSNSWLSGGNSTAEYKGACEIFVNNFTRNIDGNSWGFIVYKDLLSAENNYSVSLRAVAGMMDVQKIAKHFGGGGHIPAAGCKIKADSVEDATQQLLDYIRSIH